MTNAVNITREFYASPDAQVLLCESTKELLERYGQDTEPGPKPTAADIAVFLVARSENDAAIGAVRCA